MSLLIQLVSNRFVLGILGVLLLVGGGFWAGWSNRPVQPPVTITRTVTEVQVRDRIVVVETRPDGTVISTTTDHVSNTNTNTATPVASNRARYSVTGSVIASQWKLVKPDYAIELGRRILDTPFWVTAGYIHRVRPELSLGMRVEF